MVANRIKIECAGECQALTITIQGHSTTADYYVLPVVACQLVLGVQGLETLEPIETDYLQPTMTFTVEGISYMFQELKQTGIEALKGKEFNSLQGTEFFFQIIPSSNNSQHNSYPPAISRLLVDFTQVFEPPTSLPLKPSHDHRIPFNQKQYL